MCLAAYAQQDDKPQYVDGIKTPRWGSSIRSSEIAYVENKPDGFYIYTKIGVRRHYWNYFRKKSKMYALAVPNPMDDSNVQYILNGVPLNTRYERTLADISDKTFISINLVDERTLNRMWNVYGKKYGIIIQTRR